MATDPHDNPSNLGQAIQDVTERAQVLVREEIELAKAEIQIKVKRLARAAAAGGAAGVFALGAVILLLHAFGRLWFDVSIVNSVALSYTISGVILLLIGAIAGFLAYRWVKKATPPTPELAIEEAKRIQQTVQTARAGGAVR